MLEVIQPQLNLQDCDSFAKLTNVIQNNQLDLKLTVECSKAASELIEKKQSDKANFKPHAFWKLVKHALNNIDKMSAEDLATLVTWTRVIWENELPAYRNPYVGVIARRVKYLLEKQALNTRLTFFFFTQLSFLRISDLTITQGLIKELYNLEGEKSHKDAHYAFFPIARSEIIYNEELLNLLCSKLNSLTEPLLVLYTFFNLNFIRKRQRTFEIDAQFKRLRRIILDDNLPRFSLIELVFDICYKFPDKKLVKKNFSDLRTLLQEPNEELDLETMTRILNKIISLKSNGIEVDQETLKLMHPIIIEKLENSSLRPKSVSIFVESLSAFESIPQNLKDLIVQKVEVGEKVSPIDNLMAIKSGIILGIPSLYKPYLSSVENYADSIFNLQVKKKILIRYAQSLSIFKIQELQNVFEKILKR